jgi:hypothetical protein
MNSPSLNPPVLALRETPVALNFLTEQLLAQVALVPQKPGVAVEGMMEAQATGAAALTSILSEIEGYDHSGLNE